MSRRVFCYECRQWKDFDLATYICFGIVDPVSCPCGRKEVVPQPIDEVKWGIFSIDSLEPPSDVHRWLNNGEE